MLAAPLEDRMTKRLSPVPPVHLSSEALEMLNSRKRTVLFVVEDGRAIGLLHMHDLLRAGVA